MLFSLEPNKEALYLGYQKVKIRKNEEKRTSSMLPVTKRPIFSLLVSMKIFKKVEESLIGKSLTSVLESDTW